MSGREKTVTIIFDQDCADELTVRVFNLSDRRGGKMIPLTRTNLWHEGSGPGPSSANCCFVCVFSECENVDGALGPRSTK